MRTLKHGDSFAVLALAGAWLLMVLAAAPSGDFPLFDDWVYAHSAFTLARGGGLSVPEWSSILPLFEALWGGLFVSLFGAHHAVLRAATLVLATAGAAAWYRLLLGRGLDAGDARLSLALVLFNPVYFLLSASFMSDVAMLALWQLGLYATWRWAEAASERGAWASWAWMSVATGLALAAAYTRQTGAALLVGLAAAAWVSGRRVQLALVLATAVAVVTGTLGFDAAVGAELPINQRLDDIALAFSVSPLLYLRGAVVAAAFVGLAVAPAALASARPQRRSVLIACACMAAFWLFDSAPLLRDGTMWGACELGGARRLLSGRPEPCAWQAVARVAALVLAACALGVCARRVPGVLGRVRRGDRFAVAAAASLATLGLGNIALWLFADRYWLAPALLGAPLLLVGGERRSSRGWLLVCLYAAVAVVGTTDVARFYGDANAAADELRASGVVVHSIDAGYAVNGERRYLRSPRARARSGRNASVGWVSSLEAARYTVANTREPGWRVLSRHGRLLVVTPGESPSRRD